MFVFKKNVIIYRNGKAYSNKFLNKNISLGL